MFNCGDFLFAIFFFWRVNIADLRLSTEFLWHTDSPRELRL